MSLAGKVALVTGGSWGIGLSIARTFAADGAQVMITARREDGLRDAARQVDGAEWFVGNADRPEDAQAAVAECIDRLGALDILVNNAATNPYAESW